MGKKAANPWPLWPTTCFAHTATWASEAARWPKGSLGLAPAMPRLGKGVISGGAQSRRALAARQRVAGRISSPEVKPTTLFGPGLSVATNVP